MPKFNVRPGEHLKIAKSSAHAAELEHPSAKLVDPSGVIHSKKDGSTVVELSEADAKSIHESNPGCLEPLDDAGVKAFNDHDDQLGRVRFVSKFEKDAAKKAEEAKAKKAEDGKKGDDKK